jgi:hypothetical protein
VTSGRRSAIPVAVGPVRPSPSLLRHVAHCCNHSGAVGHAGTERHHACYCTTYGSSSTAPSSPPGDAPVNRNASTLEGRHDWGKIRQDGHQLPATVRHAAARSKIVRHACKSPSPWSIKGRRSPRCRGIGQRTVVIHTLSVSPRYWHLSQSLHLGLGGHASSPATLVATPLQAPRCKQYSASSTPLLDVRLRPEPG